MKLRSLVAALLALIAVAPAHTQAIQSPSEFLGMTVGADRTLADYRQILAYFKALDAASPRVELEMLGKTTLGEDLFLAAISSETNIANKKRLQEIARKIADPRGLCEAETEALVREGKLFLFITCNIHASEIGASQMAMEWAHALATARGRRDEAAPRRGGGAAAAVDQPRRAGDGDRVVPEEPRHALRGRAHAVALPPLRRPRQQPRLVHADAEGDAGRHARGLPRVAAAGLARRAPDGADRAAHLRAALRRAGRPRHPPAGVARRQPDRREHGVPARAAEEERRHLRLRVRRLLAGRHQEHGVVEEHLRAAHRGGLGAARDARAHRAERALGRRQGPRRVRHADELPEPVAGRQLAAARHHGLRADRLRRDPRELRRAARRLPPERARAGEGRDRRRSTRKDAFRIPAAQRDAAGAARLAALLVEHGVEVRAAANGDAYVPLAQPYGRFVAGDADAAALSRDEARAGQGDRAPVRRRGLDAAADDGRERRAHDAARGAFPVEGRDADAGDGRQRPSRSRRAAPRPPGS